MYWREACAIHNDKKEIDGIWKDGTFVPIMKEYYNLVLSGKHSIITRDIFKLTSKEVYRSQII